MVGICVISFLESKANLLHNIPAHEPAIVYTVFSFFHIREIKAFQEKRQHKQKCTGKNDHDLSQL